MKLHIFILTVLSLGLLLTAVIKNYHHLKFFALKENKKLTTFELVFAVVGSRLIAFVWIFPFSIVDNAPNAETKHHKDKFNLVSKYFRLFWTALVIYCLLIVVANK